MAMGVMVEDSQVRPHEDRLLSTRQLEVSPSFNVACNTERYRNEW